MSNDQTQQFDVFLSHAHSDADIVERLAVKLEEEAQLNAWLDKWILVPGGHWQQGMAKGLEQAKTCAVCISQETPDGWFREEIERALVRQVKDPTFRVIPVILPNGNPTVIDDFLQLRTWVQFKSGLADGYAFHLLTSGVRGTPPGRYISSADKNVPLNDKNRKNLERIRSLRNEKLIDENIALEYQRRILDEIIGR